MALCSPKKVEFSAQPAYLCFIMSSIQDLISDFEMIDDWEERYRYVIELGRGLPPMNDALKSPATKVNGCASQVWIYSTLSDGPKLNLQGDSDALIVKGLIAIAFMIFEPLNLSEIAAVDAQAIFAKLGLKDHLTPQRSNGLASMVARIKADAARGLS
jgi:cysteine desulfuration protein SufE